VQVNILLVEDDAALGEVTAALLVSEGYEVKIAPTAQDAFDDLAAPHAYSAVLLDLQLGRDRGDALVRRLRRSGQTLPPVVIFSAQPMVELREAAQEIGAVAVLQKPCRIGQIMKAISRAVGS
jgi:DNA-binding response OmpR family regulator